MQPNNQPNLPEINSEKAPDGVPGMDSNTVTNDDIFLVKPPEKKPIDKKGIGIVAGLTVVGVILLIAVLIFALIGSADGLAKDYRRLALQQVVKTNAPLKELAPELVINKRNTDSAVARISLSEQSQPSLDSVLFVGQWSDYYKSTEKMQSKVSQYYDLINKYTDTLKKTLEFDAKIQEITNSEPSLVATIDPSDTLTIRSVSGSYNTFSKKIADIEVGSELVSLKKELVELYAQESAMYLSYAKAVEAKDAVAIEKVKLEISQASASVTVATEDQVYVDALRPTYDKLIATYKALVSGLSR